MITPTFKDRIIAPSLLAADFSCIQKEVSRSIEAGADWLHLDVMDGNFVDNISFGPAVINAIHETNDIFLDVHLMISRPDLYLQRFIEAGADLITVHVESEHNVAETLKRIKGAGCEAGLALNPETSLQSVKEYLTEVDLLLCMTVQPGFGGQSFMAEMMSKVKEAQVFRDENELDYHIQVDGGLNETTTPEAYKAGANVIVAGSATFKAPDMKKAITSLRSNS